MLAVVGTPVPSKTCVRLRRSITLPFTPGFCRSRAFRNKERLALQSHIPNFLSQTQLRLPRDMLTGIRSINIVLKDYVRLAGPGTSFVFSNFTNCGRTILNLNRTDSLWDLDPRSQDGKTLFSAGAAEGTGNQVSAEFNLIYRWHSCISKKDEAWTEKQYAALLSQTPKSDGVSDFLKGVRRMEEAIPDDPVQRSLADLTRDPVTKAYQDDDLANILTSSIEDVAGAFGANQVPVALREVEILGILQGRQWGLASLNEFRRYFNLEPYITFEDLNPDPHVAQQLRGLYGHPDHVELYTGLVVEEGKDPHKPPLGVIPALTLTTPDHY